LVLDWNHTRPHECGNAGAAILDEQVEPGCRGRSLALAKAAASAGKKSETLLVTSNRACSEKAPEVKRDSRIVVEVSTSEDFGKLPDKNIAEALQRVVVSACYGNTPSASAFRSVEPGRRFVPGLCHRPAFFP
jgi:hypothetical protein